MPLQVHILFLGIALFGIGHNRGQHRGILLVVLLLAQSFYAGVAHGPVAGLAAPESVLFVAVDWHGMELVVTGLVEHPGGDQVSKVDIGVGIDKGLQWQG